MEKTCEKDDTRGVGNTGLECENFKKITECRGTYSNPVTRNHTNPAAYITTLRFSLKNFSLDMSQKGVEEKGFSRKNFN